MKLSIMTLVSLQELERPGMTLEKLYAMAADAGFAGVDLTTMEWNQLGTEGIQAALQKAGLPMSCYLCFTPLFSMDDTQFEQAVQLGLDGIDFCRTLGCGFMMVVPLLGMDAQGFPLNLLPNFPRQALADRLVEGLRRLTPYAAAQQVTLGVEDDPHTSVPLCTTDELRYVLERVPEVQLIYDTANMLAMGEDSQAYFNTFQNRIGHLHLKDVRLQAANAPEDQLLSVFPGEGVVDFPALFRQLHTMRYDGWMAVESVPAPADWPAAVQTLRRWIAAASR